ncbi:MAG: subclass B3 metallo-beta-lactamase [bacterium]
MSNLDPATLRALLVLPLALALPTSARSQQRDSARAFDYSPTQCASCAEWNAPQKPLRIFGNTWYVGTHGLGAVLITSPQGHVLIDGGIPASAPAIIANIRALGFLVEDVRLIVNSHAHFDHAGGIAELQRASGADVAASPWSAQVFRAGQSGADDPQYGVLLPYAPIRDRLRTVADGETLHVGALAITAHLTPGHTPGGTTWSWRSCEGDVCKDMVYADSQTPISADGFLYTRNTTYPSAIADFERGANVLEHLSCDILITPHPGASNFWARVESGALTDTDACKRYAASARAALAKRVATEKP